MRKPGFGTSTRIWRWGTIVLMAMFFSGSSAPQDIAPTWQSREAVVPGAANLADKFVGVLIEPHTRETIALQITETESLPGEILFQYVLNRPFSRESGRGKIIIEQNVIELQNGFSGILTRDDRQRIIMTSLSFNSSCYWKIQEAGS